MRKVKAKLIRENAYKAWFASQYKEQIPLSFFIKKEKTKFKVKKKHGEKYR